jgi:hypothetical protein
MTKLKRQFYISFYLPVLILSLVCLNSYSIKPSWNCGPDKSYVKELKYTSDSQNLEDPNEYNTWEWETLIQSDRPVLSERTAVRKDRYLTTVLLHQILLNPSLIDLPPPPLSL